MTWKHCRWLPATILVLECLQAGAGDGPAPLPALGIALAAGLALLPWLEGRACAALRPEA